MPIMRSSGSCSIALTDISDLKDMAWHLTAALVRAAHWRLTQTELVHSVQMTQCDKDADWKLEWPLRLRDDQTRSNETARFLRFLAQILNADLRDKISAQLGPCVALQASICMLCHLASLLAAPPALSGLLAAHCMPAHSPA